ncbi:hypothetical protein MKQ68_23500 [Chitinophaga horti]|uniref:Uncharacterized protein n=1 Tax=Chitinophaga horti TaxID=2920382 RepID=A0ABY6J099_9BACT|nr:hypothetical protein [Chitinophaga horti]UYQ93050.1 hypothetical protein MKQ68_23500 [Chitinophaga horti]
MRSIARFSILGMLMGLAACAGTEQQPRTAAGYRNLRQIFTDEAAQLQQQRPIVTKVVRLNGVTDTVTLADTTNLLTLFQPFMEADISKPSLQDAYSEGITANAFNGDTSVIYSAKGKQTRPAQVILQVDRNRRLRNANITSSASNMLYRFKQELRYERDKSIRINTIQKVLFLDEEEMEVIVQFGGQTSSKL